MAFDIDACRVFVSQETKKPVLFKTADKHAYDVYPCASLFAGKPHAGKSIYLPYAVNRWKNYEEAFGLIPTFEIRPVCFALDRGETIKGIECMNPFRLGINQYGFFEQFIQQLSDGHSYNVIFIDNLRALCSHLTNIPQSLQVSDQQAFIGDFLSKLSSRLGIYIFVLHHLSKSKDRVFDIQDAILGTNGIVGSYFAACYITDTTNSHIDLLFDWRSKIIKRRVIFGKGLNELIPESESSLSERLEEKRFEKYDGYEQLRELLLQFIAGPVSVRSAKSSMKSSSSRKIHRLLVAAKEDGYLHKDGAKGSYRLSEKGYNEVHAASGEIAGITKDLIRPPELELFNRFAKETLGYDESSLSPDTELSITTFAKWKIWKDKISKPVITVYNDKPF